MQDSREQPPAAGPDPQPQGGEAAWLPLRVAVVYAVCATAWILFSDVIVESVGLNHHEVAVWQTYKATAFVIITACVLFSVLRRRMAIIARVAAAQQRAEAEVQRVNAELERRIAERTIELETKNRELSRFAATVSHDLKSPLGRIEGFGSLLESEHGHALNEEGRRYLAAIRRSTKDMAALIDDLLAYARVEQRPAENASFSLVQLTQDVLEEFEPDLTQQQARVSFSIAIDRVHADREGLRSALRNLVANAIKFTSPEKPPRLHIGSSCDGRMCTVWVADEGIGFDMAEHDRIFEIFERLHRSAEYPGTGVGLAIVAKAMQRMGGSVRAESKPGGGSTFFLQFPIGA